MKEKSRDQVRNRKREDQWKDRNRRAEGKRREKRVTEKEKVIETKGEVKRKERGGRGK